MKIISRSGMLPLLFWLVLGCQAPIPKEQQVEKLAKMVSVRVFASQTQDKLGGSGVLIDRQGSHYLVITNDHVVSNRQLTYKIQTFDGRSYAGVIISPPQSRQANDLALLTFKAAQDNYQVLKIESQPKIIKEETVLAGGFPFFDDFHQAQDFHFTRGKVMMALDQPFLGGYAIGYTNFLRSGMSGGPVINQKGELIAINGMAQNPLLGNPYIFRDGTTVSESAWKEVSQLSWAIPVQEIKKFVQQYHQHPSQNATESR
ncbi:MAG: trypsin-like peptidase domain-containing protein [Microcystis aeruginosa G13-07]|jgi:S1-C subfamily serine protease|nr:serine protease [Microcystis sp. LE19-12.2C]NCS05097.1 trypsin-like peptidase domain-containing protein [Microcystis aeruginosa G13-07]